MFKRLLFETLILDRLKIDPQHMLVTTFALYFVVYYIATS